MNPGPSVAASLLCSSGNTGVANGAYGRFLCLDGDDLRGRSLSERKHRHEGLVLKVRDGWLRWPVGSTGIMSQAATALRLRVQSMASAQDDCFQVIPSQCAHHWTLASHALIQSHCKLPYAIMDWHPIMRSTLATLDRWISTEVLPPPSEPMPVQIAGDDPTVLRAPTHLPSSLYAMHQALTEKQHEGKKR